jgi:hypothetical protein
LDSWGVLLSEICDLRIDKINEALKKDILNLIEAEKQIIQILEEYRYLYNPKRV